jgi:hypothetical protein
MANVMLLSIIFAAIFFGAGPCRPGQAGATRPGSDFFYEINLNNLI